MSDLTHAIRNAKTYLETIVGSYKACQWLMSDYRDGNDLNNDARRILREKGHDTNPSDDVVDWIQDDLREDALSVEVRCSEWSAVGSGLEPDEWRILLTTGGPALQVVGDLTCGGCPTNPRVQVQDWGTPWTDYETTREEDDALEWFASLFYFGE